MSVLTDLSTYAISAAAARQLERPLFGHFIDGEAVPSADGATMPVLDPATGEQVATAAAGSQADVDRAVQSARTAFDDGRWRYLAPLEQERRLRRLAALIGEHADELADLDTIDSGLLRWYTAFIVQFAVDSIEYYSGWPSKLHGTMPPAPAEFAVTQVREPIGVVGAIIPWNGPTFGAAGGLFPLCAGNSVVLKPAEQTPMTALLVAELALEAGIPPGVFNVVQGTGAQAGAAIVDHPQVDALTFTGSGATGRAIQAAAAPRVKRVGLELGGKSPLIVFPDADLEGVTAAATMARLGSLGPGLHVQHARARARRRVRPGRRRDRRAVARHAARQRLRSRSRHGAGRVGRAARAHPALRADRPRRGRAARARRLASRRPSATSTSRRSSPTCATTWRSRRRRSSGR